MRLAIPEFHGRVSPAFDSCHRLLIVDKVVGTAEQVTALNWSSLHRGTRASRLKHLDVEVLICGGISNWLAGRVEDEGIRVIAWVSGEIPQVIEAYFLSRLVNSELSMPGWCDRETKAHHPAGTEKFSARKGKKGDG